MALLAGGITMSANLWLPAYWQGIMIVSGIGAIAALGLHVTIKSGQFSLVHGALMGASAYASGIVAVHWGLGFWATTAIGAGAGSLLGLLVAVVVLRLEGLILSIATLAIGLGLSLVASNSPFLGSTIGYTGVPLNTDVWEVALLLAISLTSLLLLKRTRIGLGLEIAGRDPVAAASLGVPVARLRIAAFAAGGCLAGMAGAINVQYVSFVSPLDLGFATEVQLLLFVILGGMTTPLGAIAGAFGVTLGGELLRFTQLDRAWILGLVLMATALLRPEGLLQRSRLRDRGTRNDRPQRSASRVQRQ
jgi:branched-chain amino acid transport system permease protein